MSVWVAQCLCPNRHCVLANAGEAEDAADAEAISAALKEAVEDLVAKGVMNPWCSLCRATALTWRYELGRTRFETLVEAEPTLLAAESVQLLVNELFGDNPNGAH